MSSRSVGDRGSRVAHLVERAAALMRADAALRQPEVLADEAPLTAEQPEAEVEVGLSTGIEVDVEVTIPPQSRSGSGGEFADVREDAQPDQRLVPDKSDQGLAEAAAGAVPEPSGGPPATAAGSVPPVEAVLPAGPPMLDIAALQRAGLVLTGGRSRIAEEFRIVVTRALRALRGSRAGRAGAANLLMITSARPNEGKSFSSLNIAASIAQNGLSDVLLIDLDAKPRSLSALLGLGGRDGLLDLAAGWGSPSAAAGTLRGPEPLISRTGIEGLSVMPIGARKPGAEGAVTRAVSTTLERLSRRFSRHVIVLDTAPCLSTSDPSTLASLVDEVLLVVEAEQTQRSEVEASLDLLKAASNVTLLLNKTRLTQRHTFGSYYYFDEPAA